MERDPQDLGEEGHRHDEEHRLSEEETQRRKTPEAERRRAAIFLGFMLGRHGNEEEEMKVVSVRLPNAMDIKREDWR